MAEGGNPSGGPQGSARLRNSVRGWLPSIAVALVAVVFAIVAGASGFAGSSSPQVAPSGEIGTTLSVVNNGSIGSGSVTAFGDTAKKNTPPTAFDQWVGNITAAGTDQTILNGPAGSALEPPFASQSQHLWVANSLAPTCGITEPELAVCHQTKIINGLQQPGPPSGDVLVFNPQSANHTPPESTLVGVSGIGHTGGLVPKGEFFGQGNQMSIPLDVKFDTALDPFVDTNLACFNECGQNPICLEECIAGLLVCGAGSSSVACLPSSGDSIALPEAGVLNAYVSNFTNPVCKTGNALCTAAGKPHACCTGAGTGTCIDGVDFIVTADGCAGATLAAPPGHAMPSNPNACSVGAITIYTSNLPNGTTHGEPVETIEGCNTVLLTPIGTAVDEVEADICEGSNGGVPVATLSKGAPTPVVNAAIQAAANAQCLAPRAAATAFAFPTRRIFVMNELTIAGALPPLLLNYMPEFNNALFSFLFGIPNLLPPLEVVEQNSYGAGVPLGPFGIGAVGATGAPVVAGAAGFSKPQYLALGHTALLDGLEAASAPIFDLESSHNQIYVTDVAGGQNNHGQVKIYDLAQTATCLVPSIIAIPSTNLETVTCAVSHNASYALTNNTVSPPNPLLFNVPLAVIGGKHTKLSTPEGIAAIPDPDNDGTMKLFVANVQNNTITAFDNLQNGDATPDDFLRGPNTKLFQPIGVAAPLPNPPL